MSSNVPGVPDVVGPGRFIIITNLRIETDFARPPPNPFIAEDVTKTMSRRVGLAL
ncbi:hypothetical protein [Halothermothrix orenii]|uniref:hypothetical protein n=1 Tax=Halothermothrix orenii TaxID=31909 RepID=UPI00143936F9|nr:hypothetical protein [Halothermothrix orenii]